MSSGGVDARVVGVLVENGDGSDATRRMGTRYSGYEHVAVNRPDGSSVQLWIDRGDPLVRVHRRDDGSVLVNAGMLRRDDDLGALLDDLRRNGASALSDVNFHGFLVGYDVPTDTLRIARDAFGVEVGYVGEFDGGVAFADRMEPLLAAGVPHEVTPEAIDILLTSGSFPAPLTPYAAIRKLSPGEALGLRLGQRPDRTHFGQIPSRKPITDAAARPAARHALTSSIGDALVDEPGTPALLLSGGIDSAMLAVAVRRYLDRDIHAYTFRYAGYEGALNEGTRASVVARALDIPHEEIEIRPENLVSDLIDATTIYGEPFTWGIHSYLQAPIAAAGHRVVFSGAGADASGLAKRLAVAARVYELPPGIRNLARLGARAAGRVRPSVRDKSDWLARTVDTPAQLFSPDAPGKRSTRAGLYSDPGLVDAGERRLAEIYDRAMADSDANFRTALRFLDLRFTDADVMMAWNRVWSRAHGMVASFPYFDREYMRIAMNVEGSSKDVIRELAAEVLPPEAANAPKHPQQAPVSAWLRGPLAADARERLADLPPGMSDIFDRSAVLQLVDDHADGRADNGWLIIALLTTSSWYASQVPSPA